MVGLAYQRQEGFQSHEGVGVDGGCGADVFIEFRAVDVDVYYFGPRGIAFHGSGHAIVEAQADGNE